MSLYTRAGDSGQTDLPGGARVSKAHPRVACCGAADELTCALGLARSLCRRADTAGALRRIQETLIPLAGELAGGSPDRPVDQGEVAWLEALTDRAMAEAGPWTGFVLPGEDAPSAALHLARAAARRLEREMVAAGEAGCEIRPALFSYVNRLSDALFALARQKD